MKLLLIPDKFKGSLTAAQVRSAITEGVRQVFPTAGIASFEASDGGDGFLDVVRSVRKIETHTVSVEDPLGRKIPAPFLFDPVRGEAFVEMATASGLLRLAESEQSPLRTHTRGTGQLIRAAIRLGARKVFVGLGGSATNDGGCGIATVFGYRFLDKNDQELEPIGQNLGAITRILPPKDPNLYNKVEIIAVNDVSNPLWGPSGAAFVYAAQKGAFGAEISMLDSGLRQLDALVSEQFGMEAGGLQGAGAAGGAAFGLYAFLGARFVKGSEYILDIIGIGEYLEEHTVDFIVTGEGKIDAQTLSGKLIRGVTALAGHFGVPVLAICGACEVPAETLREAGIEEVLVVADPSRSLSDNMSHAAENIREAISRYFLKLKDS